VEVNQVIRRSEPGGPQKSAGRRTGAAAAVHGDGNRSSVDELRKTPEMTAEVNQVIRGSPQGGEQELPRRFTGVWAAKRA